MNIRQLEAFRATILAGTVSGAASLLGVSQPAISRLLSELERSLKLSLFDRSKGRLVPTPEAHLIYEEVERTFISVDKIQELATDVRRAQTGQLRIAALPALALGFLPDAIQRFKTEHPKVFVSLTIQTSLKIEEWAAAQQIDFGIAEFPFGRAGVEIEDFCRTALVLVVPVDHPLPARIRRRGYATPQDVGDEKFISFTTNTVGRMLVDRTFQRAEVGRLLTAESQYSAAIAGLVERGLGVGLVDPFTARDFVRRGAVIALRFEPPVDFHLGILHPAHRPLSLVARNFLRLLRNLRSEALPIADWRAAALKTGEAAAPRVVRISRKRQRKRPSGRGKL